jgi:glycosyltransferase involved in cell wall biosynthesis
MKICLIVPGGVDRSGTRRVIPVLLALIERLALAHELHVIALFQEPEPCRYALRGATVHNIGRGRTALRALAAICTEHRRARFAVFHAIWASSCGMLGAIASRLLRRPLVVHVAGGELVSLPEIGYGDQRTWRGRARVRIALAGAARATAPSAAIVELAARHGYRAERLPFGIDLGAWPPAPPRPRSPTRPARLVHVASLNPVKDQAILIRAMAQLAQHGIAFTLDVVGEDTLDGRVQALAREQAVADRVRFHGFLEQDRLRPIVQAADLLVMSSRHETGPAVLVEAAAAGVPAVGTAVGLIREWAPDAAVAVPVGNAAALAREVRALLDDDARRIGIATLAQQRAITEDADWTAEHVNRIYQELTA